MADIFISYSSKDRPQAEQLSELLASAGLSVWIDKQGIEAATSWSGEITRAIDGCKALVVLLSPFSVASKNVTREVSLAFERNKKILPLDLEPVPLSDDLAYHLAGLQRTAMTNIDSIIRALAKLGLEATQPPTIKLVRETDARKSLMILPFEDLSPTGDNGWFADGIVSELISGLSNVKALRVADQQATKEYKRYTGTLPVYAKEMNVRYFVQGDVRKFGDHIKVTARLLDIETGDHLWQEALKGTMDDVFEMQEQVAAKVVEGLNVILESDEKKKLADRGTENAEAYELYMKAQAYFNRDTKDDYYLALGLYSEVIRIDPTFADVYRSKADVLARLYRAYDRNPALLEEALELVRESQRIKPNLWRAYVPLSHILMLQGKLEEAEAAVKEYVAKEPEDPRGYFALGFFYSETGQPAKAVAPYEAAIVRKYASLTAYFNLCGVLQNLREEERLRYWANDALPLYEKQVRLFPDDENAQVGYAVLLNFAGHDAEAKAALLKLENAKDGRSLYNTACLWCAIGEYESGLRVFQRSLTAGFRYISLIKELLHGEDEGVGKLKGTPAWEEVRQVVEALEREEAEAHG